MEAGTAVIERLVDAFNARDFDLADTLYARDFVSHNPAPFARPTGAGGAGTQAMRVLAEAIPDARSEIVRLVPKDDRVVAHFLVHGRHERELVGVAPTGSDVVLEFIKIYRIRDGLIVEDWGLIDALELMEQLGVAPQTAQA